MSKKNNLPVSLILILIIGLLGFRDTGIFVTEFVSKDQTNASTFKEGEKVNILKETEAIYLVEKEGLNFQVPRDKMIRSTKSDFNYIVKNEVGIRRELDQESVRTLRKGEILEGIYLDGNESIFKSEDGITGYVDINQLEKISEETITTGYSNVDTILEKDGSKHKLSFGKSVKIKGFKDGKYIVLGMDNQEYLVPKSYLELDRSKVKKQDISRGGRRNLGKGKGALVASDAHNELGKPYVYGDIGNVGYDCSGLTYALYKRNFDISLPRTAAGQASAGSHVDRSELLPGDLVFFNTTGSGIGHVGIYIGNNNMIHASTSRRSMIVANISSGYFAQRYVTARRIVH